MRYLCFTLAEAANLSANRAILMHITLVNFVNFFSWIEIVDDDSTIHISLARLCCPHASSNMAKVNTTLKTGVTPTLP